MSARQLRFSSFCGADVTLSLPTRATVHLHSGCSVFPDITPVPRCYQDLNGKCRWQRTASIHHINPHLNSPSTHLSHNLFWNANSHSNSTWFQRKGEGWWRGSGSPWRQHRNQLCLKHFTLQMFSRQITMTTHWQNPSQGLCDGLTLQYPHRLTYLSIWFPAGDDVGGGWGPAGDLCLLSDLRCTKQQRQAPAAAHAHSLLRHNELCPLKPRAWIFLPLSYFCSGVW